MQKKICFPESSNPKNIEILKEIDNTQSVSLHIRRKDYLTVADGKRYMGICTDEYYQSAINYINEHVQNPVFYIFSDDVEFARENFKEKNMHIVDWNTGKDSLYDMQLMSRCKHNICANSTFSLWGARLNKNAGKLVIRPLRHDNYEKTDEKTVHENWKGWILVDSDGSVKNP